MKLSDIRRHLGELQMYPGKSLGQNFLHDQNLAQWMVSVLQIAPGEQVVEIGPGLGALTEYLVETGGRLTAIEKDGRLATFLKKRFSDSQILHEDACEFDTRQLFPGGPGVAVGNLPYYVSTAIIFNLLAQPCPFRCALFTLQREVAERFAASPGTSAYGSPSITVQRLWQVKYLRTLPATVFYPEPKVESAVVLLTPRRSDEFDPVDGTSFERLVRKGFSQRRKQLRKTLEIPGAQWEAAASLVKCNITARAEELTVRQWVELANVLSAQPANPAQSAAGEIFDVVDANDVVLRQAARWEVHAQNLFHRAVHILLFNEVGELFLQKRSHLKDRESGKWDSSAAGHLDAGEDYDAAAQRELLEELGVRAELREIGRLAPGAETGFEFIQLYRGVHSGPMHLQPSEIESGAYFSIELIECWIGQRAEDFAPGFLQCMKLYFRHASVSA